MPPISPVDEPNDEEREEKLPEDYETPFSLPDKDKPAAQPADIDDAQLADHTNDDDTGDLPVDHPAADSKLDSDELYDEGLAGAAESGEPNAENDVLSYDPKNDTRSLKSVENKELEDDNPAGEAIQPS
jgi:hypothetical protein